MRCFHSIFIVVLLTPLTQASVLDTAKQNGCAKLVGIVQAAGLEVALTQANDVTLFAPSDAAIDAVPKPIYDELSKNITLLQEVLKFHVVSGVKMAADLQNDALLTTLGSQKLRTNIYDGIIVTAEGSVVSKADLKASNGVVHVIDKVIYPVPSKSIPEFLAFDKDLTTLAYVAYTGQMLNKLMEQSFTVFAPTNAAIDKIPGQEYNDLVMNITALTDVLNYHLVNGTLYSAAIADGQQITTLGGKQLNVKVTTDGVTVNGAKVLQTDLSVTNGVIHVIDTILFPPQNAPTPDPIVG